MKVRYVLKMESVVEVMDSGYMGKDASLAEHLTHAKKQLSYYTWLLQRGSAEAKVHPVKMTVDRIIMEEL